MSTGDASNFVRAVDNSPMAAILNAAMNPAEIASLGAAIFTSGSNSQSASVSSPSTGGGVMEGLRNMLTGDVPAERPLQPAVQIAPAQHVNDGELFNFVAQQFDGVRQQASRGAGFGGIA